MKHFLIHLWRHSHFILAVSSLLFVFLATATGLILAFEPIQKKIQPFKVRGGEQIRLANLIDSLQSRYDEIIEVSVDENGFVKVSAISMEEETDGEFFINPKNGKKIADIPERKKFFEFITNLHRSLFLKTIGRIFIGITSFILFLIAITGLMLFLKRQGGIKHFFSNIIKEKNVQYYHAVTGRIMLVPIIIITLSGVYLSLLRFEFIPEPPDKNIAHITEQVKNKIIPVTEFEIFQKTKISEIQKLEFPFSDDIEEYFILELRDRELKINQQTGQIAKEHVFPFVKTLSSLSFDLHTGAGSIAWSIVLALASLNIFYFMYSGLLVSYRRISSKIKNVFRPEEAEYVILVGTENGSTRNYAGLLQKELIRLGKKVFLDDMNNYRNYQKLEKLVVMTSTYGEGDPPANASRFLDLFKNNPVQNPVQYSVVGFGSLSYPNFCQFAVEVNNAIAENKNCSPVINPFLINNKSYPDFKKWAKNWGERNGLQISLPAQLKTKKPRLKKFSIIEKESVNNGYDETFVLKIKPHMKADFQSGDLLAVYPPHEKTERLYSIGKSDNGYILLSIKLHAQGICSNYLNSLVVGSTFDAGLRKNAGFYFPKKAATVTMIANGTGIIPFIGMLNEVQIGQEINLYWGGRTYTSLSLYNNILDAVKIKGHFKYDFAFSKEREKKYVQDLLAKDENSIAEQLNQGGIFMICGSVTMQKGVLKVLAKITKNYHQKPLDFFIARDQILMDCY